ncbi:hypothetical protein [Natrinema sp. 74]|uniref:hypothetical protein n=1 Tax=Natrinema sp. 74 TaxID=3384159 RepID=UPI0038D3752D
MAPDKEEYPMGLVSGITEILGFDPTPGPVEQFLSALIRWTFVCGGRRYRLREKFDVTVVE